MFETVCLRVSHSSRLSSLFRVKGVYVWHREKIRNSALDGTLFKTVFRIFIIFLVMSRKHKNTVGLNNYTWEIKMVKKKGNKFKVGFDLVGLATTFSSGSQFWVDYCLEVWTLYIVLYKII